MCHLSKCYIMLAMFMILCIDLGKSSDLVDYIRHGAINNNASVVHTQNAMAETASFNVTFNPRRPLVHLGTLAMVRLTITKLGNSDTGKRSAYLQSRPEDVEDVSKATLTGGFSASCRSLDEDIFTVDDATTEVRVGVADEVDTPTYTVDTPTYTVDTPILIVNLELTGLRMGQKKLRCDIFSDNGTHLHTFHTFITVSCAKISY